MKNRREQIEKGQKNVKKEPASQKEGKFVLESKQLE